MNDPEEVKKKEKEEAEDEEVEAAVAAQALLAFEPPDTDCSGGSSSSEEEKEDDDEQGIGEDPSERLQHLQHEVIQLQAVRQRLEARTQTLNQFRDTWQRIQQLIADPVNIMNERSRAVYDQLNRQLIETLNEERQLSLLIHQEGNETEQLSDAGQQMRERSQRLSQFAELFFQLITLRENQEVSITPRSETVFQQLSSQVIQIAAQSLRPVMMPMLARFACGLQAVSAEVEWGFWNGTLDINSDNESDDDSEDDEEEDEDDNESVDDEMIEADDSIEDNEEEDSESIEEDANEGDLEVDPVEEDSGEDSGDDADDEEDGSPDDGPVKPKVI